MLQMRLRSGVALRVAACMALCLTLSALLWSQDSALQQATVRAMTGRSGTAVVIHVVSGKTLAAYHPETAARRVAPPGSAIKPFTLLALLESGKVNSQTALVCKRPLTVGQHKLDCTHPTRRNHWMQPLPWPTRVTLSSQQQLRAWLPPNCAAVPLKTALVLPVASLRRSRWRFVSPPHKPSCNYRR